LKRKKLIKTIKSNGCVFVRHGGNHDWYKNPHSEKSQPIPRHTEIEDSLARRMMSLYIKWVPPAWFQIKMGKKIIYTGFIPEMNKHGKIDVALLPIGGRDFTMNLTEAVQAAIMIKPLVAIPMHRFECDPQEFRKQVEKKSDIKVAALQTGEVYHLE
jgi:predicted RNA binding protein YcfA (HicA-like mRNA interferase family)